MCYSLGLFQKGLEVCYCLWGVPSRPSPGSYPGPVQVPSRVRGGPVQIRHVLCFTVFRAHPGPEVGAIPARPGPILLPSVPYRVGPGRAETDFLATSDFFRERSPGLIQHVLTVLVFWSRLLLVPRLPASSRSPRLCP